MPRREDNSKDMHMELRRAKHLDSEGRLFMWQQKQPANLANHQWAGFKQSKAYNLFVRIQMT